MNIFEDSFGCPLFIRTNRGVLLTTEGQIVYDEGRYIVDYYDHVKENIHTSLKKEFCLNVGTSLLCPHDPINKY